MSAAAEQLVFDEIETPIGGVPADMVMRVWDKAADVLRRVVRQDTGYDLDAVLTRLQLAQWQLWVIGDFQAVGVTEVQVRPLHNVLWVQFIAGDSVEDWLEDWEKVLEAFAKAHGCKAVEFNGRRGWHKFQRKFRNYKPVMTTYRREIE